MRKIAGAQDKVLNAMAFEIEKEPFKERFIAHGDHGLGQVACQIAQPCSAAAGKDKGLFGHEINFRF